MKTENHYEQLEGTLRQLGLPEDLPTLSFDPDREPARGVALRNNLLAACAGVVAIAVAFGAVVGIVRWHNRIDSQTDPPISVAPSYPSFPVDSSSSQPVDSSQTESLPSEVSSEETSSTETIHWPMASATQSAEPPSAISSQVSSGISEPVPSAPIVSTLTPQLMILEQHDYFLFVRDGWVYFRRYKGEIGIYRIRPDMTQMQWLELPTDWLPLDMDDEWIYYTDDTEDDSGNSIIYRMCSDSTEPIPYPGTEGAYSITLSNEWLYYLSDDVLYRIRIDGTDKQRLMEDCNSYLLSENEDELFITGGAVRAPGDTPHKIIRCGLDGSNPVDYIDIPTGILYAKFFHDGYLYYYQSGGLMEENNTQGAEIYRIRPDSTEPELIVHQDGPYSLDATKVHDGWIYYSCSRFREEYGRTTDTLYRVRLDGSDSKMLLDNAYFEFEFYGDHIYVGSGPFVGACYRISYDGMEQTILYQEERGGTHFASGCFEMDGVPYVILSPNSY